MRGMTDRAHVEQLVMTEVMISQVNVQLQGENITHTHTLKHVKCGSLSLSLSLFSLSFQKFKNRFEQKVCLINIFHYIFKFAFKINVKLLQTFFPLYYVFNFNLVWLCLFQTFNFYCIF